MSLWLLAFLVKKKSKRLNWTNKRTVFAWSSKFLTIILQCYWKQKNRLICFIACSYGANVFMWDVDPMQMQLQFQGNKSINTTHNESTIWLLFHLLLFYFIWQSDTINPYLPRKNLNATTDIAVRNVGQWIKWFRIERGPMAMRVCGKQNIFGQESILCYTIVGKWAKRANKNGLTWTMVKMFWIFCQCAIVSITKPETCFIPCISYGNCQIIEGA